MYRYKLRRLKTSGICDICKLVCYDIYLQIEEKHHNFNSNDIYSVWSQYGCIITQGMRF
ncbi:MAG: hypothetical protein H6Q69_216 [Firmicutes bacterium]|nr:hypothetical protein [Bacillota bacterium]